MYFNFKILTITTLSIFITSCSTIDSIRCFSIDGKSALNCSQKLRAERLCSDKKGLENWNYSFAKCNDGTEFKRPY